MSIKGVAITVPRVSVISPCGFEGLAGYKEKGDVAQLSFMPETNKVHVTVTSLNVDGREAKVIKQTPSDYIEGMWTFLIKYQE